MVCLHPAADVHVRHLLHHRRVQLQNAVPLPPEPGLPVHPLFPQDRYRGHGAHPLVPPAHVGGRGHCAGDRVLDV